MSNKKHWKPGEEADSNLNLYVVDSNGKHLGEVTVQKGDRIPPTRITNATGYIEK